MQQEKENPQKSLQKSFLAAPLTAAHTWNALSWKEPSPVSAQVWQRTKCKARPSILTDSAGKLPFSRALCSSFITPSTSKALPQPSPAAHFSPSFLAQLCFPLSAGNNIFGGIWAPVRKKPLQCCAASTDGGARLSQSSTTGCLSCPGRWSSHGTLGFQGRAVLFLGNKQE